MKLVANNIFGVFEKYKAGQCTYDRALEDVSKIIEEYSDQRPIVGYVKSGVLKDLLFSLLRTKKQNKEKSHLFEFELHNNAVDQLTRIYELIQH